MLEEQSVVKLAEGISLYGCAGESDKFYIFNTLSGDHFSVNAFGYAALAKVDGSLTIGQIVDDCLSIIKVDRKIFLNDIVELFDACVRHTVLELVKG